MFAASNIKLHQELIKEAEEKVAGMPAINPAHLKMLLAAGAGGLAVGGATHLIDKANAEEERARTRNHAFGAGVASGVAAPHVVRHLFDIAQNRGLMAPPSEFG